MVVRMRNVVRLGPSWTSATAALLAAELKTSSLTAMP